MREYQVLGGRYRLDGEVGRGGMAVVWRAYDEVLGRAVAVKVLDGQYVTDPDARVRIREEARAAARLSHPNIAQVHDFGEVPDGGDVLPYVVMELVSGVTLARRLRTEPLHLEAALRCCAEVAAALTAAHEEGLVHRDIKPANVMLTRQGAKVVDFGIAAVATPGSGGAPAEVPMGTPGYIAPERLTGDGVLPATDVYALGVLLYLLISGRAPWTAESITEMLDAHVYTEPDPLPPLPHVPAAVVDLCHRCLHKDPAARPSAREAAVVLARAAGVRVVTGGAGEAEEPSIALTPRPAATGYGSAEGFEPGAGSPAGSVPAAASAGETTVPPPHARSQPAPTPPEQGAAATPQRDGSAAPARGAATPTASGDAGPRPADGERARRRRIAVVAGTLALLAAGGLTTALLLGTADPDTAARPGLASGAPDAPLTTTPPAATGTGIPGSVPGLVTGTAPAGPGGTVRSSAGVTRTGTAAPQVPEVPGQDPAPAATSGPPPPVGTPPPDPQPQQRTLASGAGTVEATCTGSGQAQLLSYTPIKPYKTQSVAAGPADAAEIVFRHGNRYVTMTVTCAGGVPSAVTTGE
ncbi:serine/threonine-protein kinase [Catenuloplanes nepalensis]|uniref:non-specific serine/threonine protein kinase n=1 Tax=Catenuloplanes nepalensis TaxID=587533 RepID=A0ABT9MS40_9ACTN|nr:serine/threonine-protein kinase [Catenuloplanes nepalensis]MDP9794257.1 serine/threonine-protein kinase [Catenuloplanes nepalensis]